jgi:hypothetical protein
MTSRASFSGMMEGALNLLTDSFKNSSIVYFTAEKNWTSSTYKRSSLTLMQTLNHFQFFGGQRNHFLKYTSLQLRHFISSFLKETQ